PGRCREYLVIPRAHLPGVLAARFECCRRQARPLGRTTIQGPGPACRYMPQPITQESPMPELNVVRPEEPDEGPTPDVAEEVDRPLTRLRKLRDRVHNPVIRSCLDATRADIVRLTSTGDREAGESRPGAAA